MMADAIWIVLVAIAFVVLIVIAVDDWYDQTHRRDR